MTEWRDVEGWPGYSVSDEGQVRGQRGWVLKPAIKNSGHLHLTFYAQGCKKKNFYVHNLVLRAFVGPPPPGMECRHLDGNPANNHLSNLRWGTRTEQAADKLAHDTQPRGVRHGRVRLTEQDVRSIRVSDETLAVLADRYGVAMQTISKIRRREKWTHIP